jgi:hypothetical protein
MSSSLTAQILTQSSITMLVQVLTDDNSASVKGLEIASLGADFFGNRRERVRVAWEGEKGTGQRDFLLYASPPVTWSERVNPNLPAPAPVLLVESDLPDAFTMLREGFVASGRRRGERPAWLLREDWTAIKTIEMNLSDREKDEGLTQNGATGTHNTSYPFLSALLEKTAAFHALHWGAEKVLDDVYPWLPRFTAQLESDAWNAGHRDAPTTLRVITHLPQTIIHGTWRAEHLRFHNGELLVEGWDRVMVGPAAWDVYCLLDSLGLQDWERWIREYCGYLKGKVTEIEGTDEFVSIILALRNG